MGCSGCLCGRADQAVAPRHDLRVAPARLGLVGEQVGDLEEEARVRLLHFPGRLAAVPVPAFALEMFAGSRRIGWAHDQMRRQQMDVPAENARHEGERRRVIQQFQKYLVGHQAVPHLVVVAAGECIRPGFVIKPVYDGQQTVQHFGRQRVGNHQKAVALKVCALLRGQ